jgi:GH15 family glucan-1,4-alpha-glucosidase
MAGLPDLALIGNGTISALVDGSGRIVWACLPRFDGEPVFDALLRIDGGGAFAIEIADFARSEQHYLEDTAVLVTRLYDHHGGGVEIADFAPRFMSGEQLFRPAVLARHLTPIGGVPPRLTFRCQPAVPLRVVPDQAPATLDRPLTVVCGLELADTHSAAGWLAATTAWWREWVRGLALPQKWRDAVVRAAITLKLNQSEDTGAIVAAMTTSLPESADSGRNWDYRYCWLRDSYFVVDALNRLGASEVGARYIDFLLRVTTELPDGRLQPLFGIDGRREIEERFDPALPGFQAMGPVRIGNAAYRQVQHDGYGSAILAATPLFFAGCGDASLFGRLEPLGELAAKNFDQPDAGLWELRGSARVHTYSAVMCWAACDRLAQIAAHLGLAARTAYWRSHADRIHSIIGERAWSPQRNAFAATFGGDAMDASLLLLAELGFLDAVDPRFTATVAAIEQDLKRGDFIFRYVERDDFGAPENAFLVCSFWYVNALAVLGRTEEARSLFEKLLACRNRHGLLAEHIDPHNGDMWGNFVQTYSMAGIVDCAHRLAAGAPA